MNSTDYFLTLLEIPLWEATLRFQELYVRYALKKAGGNIAMAARMARVDRANFRRLLLRHSLLKEREE